MRPRPTRLTSFRKSQFTLRAMARTRVGFNVTNLSRSSPLMYKFFRFSLASLMLLALCALGTMAQSTVTGAINGTVTNPNKEVVVGASITAKNNGTNKESTATADDNGGFKVINLEPGTYTVTVNGSGFAPYSNENVIVEIGRSTTLDVGLSLQGVTGTVQVTAEAPVINTSQQD